MDFIVFILQSARQSTGIYITYRFHLDSLNIFPSHRIGYIRVSFVKKKRK